MTDREKIDAIINDKHLNNTQFCTEVCISPGTLSNIRSGKTEPSLNILRSIIAAFPDINPSWLFYDQGQMYLADAASTTPDSDTYNLNDPDKEPAPASVQGDLFGMNYDFSSQQNDSKSNHPNQNPGGSSHKTANNSANSQQKMAQSPGLTAVEVSAVVAETLKQQQKPQRKVVEVRIFFDDGTFETFNAN